MDEKEIITILRQDGVGIIPSDTLYGLVGLATSRVAVERIYHLKGREADKPSVILIADIDDLKTFGVVLSDSLRTKLKKLWPAKVSIILPVKHNFSHLVKGPLGTHAFRIPPKEDLRNFLRQAGPLIAPSANVAGEPPAKDIGQARAYFGDKVDFYIDGGQLIGEPSTLVRFDVDETMVIVREGADINKVLDIN